MRQDNDLVVCQGLTKRFGRQTALDRLDLNLPRGKFIGLLGPNGSGKTTMIKLINGLLTPTAGDLHSQHHQLSAGPPLPQRLDAGVRPAGLFFRLLQGF